MGEMVKKLLRATQYDVMNSEQEVKGPELYTQLFSNELHESEQMTEGLWDSVSAPLKSGPELHYIWQRLKMQFNCADDS